MLILPVVTPSGTVTVNALVLAAVTTAGWPLNLTVLFAGVALKFKPEIVTDIPVTPEAGVKLVMAGTFELGMVNEATLLSPP